MKGAASTLIFVSLALMACAIAAAAVSRSAERSFQYGVDAAAAYATSPQVQLEQSLARQQAVSPTAPTKPVGPFLLGAAAMLALYGFYTQKERNEAKTKRLKEERLLAKQTAKSRPLPTVRPPMLPMPVPQLPQLRPHTAPPVAPEATEPEIEGETW